MKNVTRAFTVSEWQTRCSNVITGYQISVAVRYINRRLRYPANRFRAVHSHTRTKERIGRTQQLYIIRRCWIYCLAKARNSVCYVDLIPECVFGTDQVADSVWSIAGYGCWVCYYRTASSSELSERSRRRSALVRWMTFQGRPTTPVILSLLAHVTLETFATSSSVPRRHF